MSDEVKITGVPTGPSTTLVWNPLAPPAGHEWCRVYWNTHGCALPRGHKGPHMCSCAYVNDEVGGGLAPKYDEDGVHNVGGPPYYGRLTLFFGEDAPRQPFVRFARWVRRKFDPRW